jgi:hypothetical protein
MHTQEKEYHIEHTKVSLEHDWRFAGGGSVRGTLPADLGELSFMGSIAKKRSITSNTQKIGLSLEHDWRFLGEVFDKWCRKRRVSP